MRSGEEAGRGRVSAGDLGGLWTRPFGAGSFLVGATDRADPFAALTRAA